MFLLLLLACGDADDLCADLDIPGGAAAADPLDGTWSGCLAVDASGTYEGTDYAWRFGCATSLTRGGESLDFLASCEPSDDDPDQQAGMDRLLGSAFTVAPYPDDAAVEGDSWTGWVLIDSAGSAGVQDPWTSEGEGGTIDWSDDAATLVFERETTFLTLSGEAALTR